jgi:hypothetical protein
MLSQYVVVVVVVMSASVAVAVGNTRVVCAPCVNHTPHGEFAFLIRSGEYSSWHYSTQPLWEVKKENRERGFVRGRKSTKCGAPHYAIELVIGTFDNSASASVFVSTMSMYNRKWDNRSKRGMYLGMLWQHIDRAQLEKLRYWCPDENKRTTLLAMLDTGGAGAHIHDTVRHMLVLANSARTQLADALKKSVPAPFAFVNADAGYAAETDVRTARSESDMDDGDGGDDNDGDGDGGDGGDGGGDSDDGDT